MVMDRRALIIGSAALTAVAGAPLSACARDERPEPPPPGAGPDAALAAAFDRARPTALAAALVDRSGVTWAGARGVRRHGRDEAVALSDRWHLGSNTKAMTAVLYARLVEAGRARWDASATDLFPGVAADPAWAGVTVEDLMRHRSGLIDASVIGLSWLARARSDPASLTEQRAAVTARALAAPPTGPQGAFAYGNANYILLGHAIERITGLSWEEAMKAEVFAPQDLASAGFGAPGADEGDPEAQPWGHRILGPLRMPLSPSDPASDNPLALGPAGTVHMNLADYARFLGLFLTDGGDLLSADSIGRLTRPPEGAAPPYAGGWGVRTGQDWGRGPVLGHEGSNTLWHAVAVVAPARGAAVIVVSNNGPEHSGASALAMALAHDLDARQGRDA